MLLRRCKRGFFLKEGASVAAGSLSKAGRPKEKMAQKNLFVIADGFLSTIQKPAGIIELCSRRFELKLFLLFPLFIILSLVFVFVWWSDAARPADPGQETVGRFIIPKGQTAARTAARLEEEGFIKSSLAFKLYVQITGQAKAIQSGDYRLSPKLNLSKIVAVLLAGPQELWVTYPEGLRREEIASRTIKVLGIESEAAQTFYQDFLKESQGLEGLLFPETYLFARDVPAANVVKKLRVTFDTKVTDKMLEDAKAKGLRLNEVATLASIIERETITDKERPVVAGILLKRMDAGWPLQVDATLQYVTGSKRCVSYQLDCDWWKPPTIEDKKLNSQYNTYLNKGLPPAPIANPGLQSIKAVIYPEDSPYWYYLHDSQGKIHYGATIEEHNENIRKYLQ